MPARSSAGFTLIELLLALVLSSIIAGTVFQLLMGQGNFARYQNAREEVQQNARAALEVISSELRGVPPLAIIQADPNAIRYRSPRAWGVLCQALPTGSTAAIVRFPAGVFPSEFLTSSATWGIAVAQTTDATQNPASWQFATTLSSVAAGNTCTTNLQASVGGVDDRGFSTTTALAGSPVAVGSLVFVFQDVSYDVGTSNVPGLWIRRNGQPMAGPVMASTGNDAGLQLTYLNSADAAAATNAGVARIRLRVKMSSTARFKGLPQDDVDSTEVYLRNRDYPN